MRIQTSRDLLVQTNMFLKIQNTHQPFLIWLWSVATAWQLGASCFFVFFFSKISILSVVLFPVFYSGGLDLWLKWLLRCECDRVWCVASSSYLSHEERRRPVPASTRTGRERSARQWSSWALRTHKHTYKYIWWTPKTNSITTPATELKDTNY